MYCCKLLLFDYKGFNLQMIFAASFEEDFFQSRLLCKMAFQALESAVSERKQETLALKVTEKSLEEAASQASQVTQFATTGHHSLAIYLVSTATVLVLKSYSTLF